MHLPTVSISYQGRFSDDLPQPQPEPEPEPEPVVEDEPKKEPVNVTGIMAIILILALGGVGGFMHYTSTKNSKKPVGADPDQDYSDEDYLRSMSSDDEDEIQLDEEHEEIDESSDDGGNE